EDELARRLGVNGVPCFIINRKYAVSGTQSPEVIVQVFDLAIQDKLDAVAE
ncbi:MAG: disulfide bond formation protein DsbA, partial [Alphaproteobacteria bacterium]|nr:disulfide bond formation protein DsbA [Alphaproteobacteria bacterium]